MQRSPQTARWPGTRSDRVFTTWLRVALVIEAQPREVVDAPKALPRGRLEDGRRSTRRNREDNEGKRDPSRHDARVAQVSFPRVSRSRMSAACQQLPSKRGESSPPLTQRATCKPA
jgi:hypothetical protein